MMGLPQTPSPPHLYPQALQLKLYQAFIFSIPILFSIILFLLFYLFYLKRRASSLSSSQSTIPTTFNQTSSYVPSLCEVGLKGELKDKLPTVLFDEELRKRDSQCCVCLGEFEIKEQLLQVPSCKHVFHIDCIRHWLHSNSTCPLCRCSVTPTVKNSNLDRPAPTNSDQSPQIVSLEQQHQEQQLRPVGDNSTASNFWREEHIVPIDVSSSANACLRESMLPEMSVENGMDYSEREVVAIHIQIPNS